MATLGTVPLTVGSLYRWQLTLTKDGAVWDLSATAVTFWWKRADGTRISQTASGNSAGVCTYADAASLLSMAGPWTLAAQVDGFGWTVPVPFSVVTSP